MEDIRLFGNDGDYLILEALDGQKFRLMADESLKSAMKREDLSKLDSITLTPREIQDHVRNGLSIDDIAKASGAPFEFIEKFAAPVIDELAHMVDSAKSVRIVTSQDRYSDSTHIEFGELVETRLANSGATTQAWNAKRGDYNTWNVSVHFVLDGGESFASWSFDPRKLTLSPENESAVNLSTDDPQLRTPIPKARPTLIAESASLPRENDEETPVAVLPIKPATTPWVTQLVPVRNEEVAPTLETTDSVVEPQRDEAPLSATADLLQALRVKRGEREAAAESAAQTPEQNPADFKTEPADDAKVDSSEQANPVPLKKGRAAMPSWDQIVFGTKTED